jgi:hypothetical protein
VRFVLLFMQVFLVWMVLVGFFVVAGVMCITSDKFNTPRHYHLGEVSDAAVHSAVQVCAAC